MVKKWLEQIQKMGISKFIICLMAGVLILLLSVPGLFSSDSKKTSKSSLLGKTAKQEIGNSETEQYVEDLEKRLSNLLQDVAGVGKNEVMITLAGSGEKIPLKDQTQSEKEATSETDSQGGNREQSRSSEEEQTVILERDGAEEPYVLRETQPQIAGVLVVASGGDEPSIKKEIIEAVQVLFHLEAHKIKVMKMES